MIPFAHLSGAVVDESVFLDLLLADSLDHMHRHLLDPEPLRRLQACVADHHDIVLINDDGLLPAEQFDALRYPVDCLLGNLPGIVRVRFQPVRCLVLRCSAVEVAHAFSSIRPLRMSASVTVVSHEWKHDGQMISASSLPSVSGASEPPSLSAVRASAGSVWMNGCPVTFSISGARSVKKLCPSALSSSLSSSTSASKSQLVYSAVRLSIARRCLSCFSVRSFSTRTAISV